MRILLIKPSALGDVATTLPLLCDLKSALPNAQIDWLIHPSNVPVIEGHDALHQIIPFDRKKLTSWYYKQSAFRLFRELLHTLRHTHYDAVIDAQGLLRSGFLTRYTGAKTRIGFANAREGAKFAYTDKIPLPDNGLKMLAVDRMRALGKPLGTDISKPAQFRMPVSKIDIPLPQSFVVLIPGARWNTKRWPIERYTEVVKNLVAEGHSLVLLGSPDEKSLCDQIQSQISNFKSQISNLAGQTNIPTMIAVLSRAQLVIANDSGPLHIAAALGRPCVALYGPTSPDFVGPYGQIENVLRHAVPCHPCRRRECDHHSCMNGLSVELVWEKTQATLNKVPA